MMRKRLPIFLAALPPIEDTSQRAVQRRRIDACRCCHCGRSGKFTIMMLFLRGAESFPFAATESHVRKTNVAVEFGPITAMNRALIQQLSRSAFCTCSRFNAIPPTWSVAKRHSSMSFGTIVPEPATSEVIVTPVLPWMFVEESPAPLHIALDAQRVVVGSLALMQETVRIVPTEEPVVQDHGRTRTVKVDDCTDIAASLCEVQHQLDVAWSSRRGTGDPVRAVNIRRADRCSRSSGCSYSRVDRSSCSPIGPLRSCHRRRKNRPHGSWRCPRCATLERRSCSGKARAAGTAVPATKGDSYGCARVLPEGTARSLL